MNTETTTRRPRWKDRPWWKNFLIGLVVGVVMIVIIGVVRDRVDAAPPPASAAASAKSATQRECISPDHETSCKEWSRKKARQFKAGKLGNSGAVTLTSHTKRLITKWYNAHPKAKAREMREDGFRPRLTADGRVVAPKVAGASWCAVCDFIPDAATCMIHIVAHPGACEDSNKDWRRVQRGFINLTIDCGGTALVGWAVAGPAGASGSGVAMCTWQVAGDAIKKGLDPCKPHSPCRASSAAKLE